MCVSQIYFSLACLCLNRTPLDPYWLRWEFPRTPRVNNKNCCPRPEREAVHLTSTMSSRVSTWFRATTRFVKRNSHSLALFFLPFCSMPCRPRFCLHTNSAQLSPLSHSPFRSRMSATDLALWLKNWFPNLVKLFWARLDFQIWFHTHKTAKFSFTTNRAGQTTMKRDTSGDSLDSSWWQWSFYESESFWSEPRSPSPLNWQMVTYEPHKQIFDIPPGHLITFPPPVPRFFLW